jgi:pimeloyl-ACP methyl ester carboxylesterase
MSDPGVVDADTSPPALPALVTESFTTAVGDVMLTRGGSGPPVVYLHSSGGESGDGDVARYLALLAEHYSVYAPMFPGYGGSEGLALIDDMEDGVYHCLDLLERLGLGSAHPPHLVGQSLGGWLAAEIAWRHPDRLASMTLVNAVGIHVPGSPVKELFGRRFDELAEMCFADQSHPVAAAMHLMASLSPKEVAAVPFDLLRPFYESMAATAKLSWNPYFHNPKMEKRLGRVSVPTLVVLGRLDGLVPNAVGEAYAELITGARVEYVEEGSHMLTIEHPDVVVGLMRQFIGT